MVKNYPYYFFSEIRSELSAPAIPVIMFEMFFHMPKI